MAYDAFLKIMGIDGESQDVTHKDWIPLESFSWGVSNSASGAAGGGRGERVMFQDFSFTALMGKQSPQLFEWAAAGRRITEAILAVTRGVSDKSSELLQIQFNQIVISSYKLDEGGLPAVQLGAPMENVSFNFESLTFKVDTVSGIGIVAADR